MFVEVEQLFFGYHHRNRVLRGVSIQVQQGQVVAIMGGSGSGKTTLLANICGQVFPQRGQLRVLGYDMMDIDRQSLYRLRRRIGRLFQFGGLFTDMTVFDNVAFPLREHTDLPPSAIRDLTLLKLEAVGLRGSATLLPAQLSGGMVKRVALARAIVLDPQLILYDEPFAGLDPISLTITAGLIRDLNDALGAGSIIVTHDVAESFKIADYVYLMWQGEVVAQGTPDEMQDSHQPYVRQFINAEKHGPLPFHQPASDMSDDLGIRVT